MCLPEDSPTRHELLSRIVNPERRKKRRQSHCHTSLPRMGKGDRVSGARVLSYAAQMRLSFHYTTSVFHTIVTLSALVNLSTPQSPSSRAQPRDLYCIAAICTHTPSLKRHLGASFFAFSSPTFYRSAKKIPPLRPS